MIEIAHLGLLRERVGHELAVSEWLVVDADRIRGFADATGDHQWIHLDAARAAAESPFGGPIAHGFLTLSLLSPLVSSAVTIRGVRLAVNYGLDRVRFVSPLPAGTRVRARVTPAAVEDVARAVQVTWHVVVEREHADRPCLVADWIVRYYTEPAER
jgi:acyl dehydratase